MAPAGHMSKPLLIESHPIRNSSACAHKRHQDVLDR